MDGHKGERKEDCPDKVFVVESTDTGIEPHAVMVKVFNTLITIFAVH